MTLKANETLRTVWTWNPADGKIEVLDMKIVKENAKEFPVVCLCGSTRYEKLFHKAAEEFTLAGFIVLTVNAWSLKDRLHDPKTAADQWVKERLDGIHKAKIDLADVVVVLDKGGYVGPSTRSEIDYARKVGKPVHYLEGPVRGAPYQGG